MSNTPPEGDNAIDPALPPAESPKKKKPARAARAKAEGKPADGPSHGPGHRAGLWTAAGIGIGSAAIAAALIYANRAKGGKDDA